MSQLPYIFDLLYDFKTVEQLHKHLTGQQRNATSATDFELIALAKDTNTPLPENINVEPPLAIALKDVGARVPATATHYLLSCPIRRAGGITRIDLSFFRQQHGAWQRFDTDCDDEYPSWNEARLAFQDNDFEEKVMHRLRTLEGNG